MEKEKITQLLTQLDAGEIDLVQALAEASADKSIADVGFARLDLSRKERCGFPEFIYGKGKTKEQIIPIIREIRKHRQPLLITKLDPDFAEDVVAEFPDAEYNESSGTFMILNHEPQNGNVLVLTAGTTDLPVAYEAKMTAEACNCKTDLIPDSGIAGIHRLLSVSNKLRDADVIIVVAGMEGALPSVVGGMVSCPVIAVPTSVGYGASLNGFAALLGMLTSCANGITVLNIDNGFGAGCAAARIINAIYNNGK